MSSHLECTRLLNKGFIGHKQQTPFVGRWEVLSGQDSPILPKKRKKVDTSLWLNRESLFHMRRGGGMKILKLEA